MNPTELIELKREIYKILDTIKDRNQLPEIHKQIEELFDTKLSKTFVVDVDQLR